MAVYRRADTPFWWYDFSVNGRRFRGSTGASSRQEARAAEAAKRTEAENALPEQGRWRLRQLTGTYWEAHGQYRASHATIFYQLEALSDGLGANTFVADLTGEMLIRYRAKRRGDGLQAASVNREMTLLRACLRFAAEHYGQPEPRIGFKSLKLVEPAGRTRFLSPDEFKRLSVAADPELRTIILLAVSTGLRRSNIVDLTWEQVNLAQKRAHVVLKGERPLVVKLAPAAVAALGRTRPPNRVGPIFRKPNLRKRWEAAVARAKLADFRFHDLRHTFASWARMGGADIAAVKDALGHSDIAMTMRYAHVTPDHQRTAFDAVADLFSGSASRSTSQQPAKLRDVKAK